VRKLLASVRSSVEQSLDFQRFPDVAPMVEYFKALNRGEQPAKLSKPKQETQAGAAAAPKEKAKLKDTVKVDKELLADLDRKLGELNSLEDRFGQGDDPNVIVKELKGVTKGLNDISARLRMVEVQPMFQKMARMVRDLSKKTDKLVKLVTSGQDTRVDRKVVEKLSAPLMHMIRNSVDHGVEPANMRKERNKPVLGTLQLSAYNEEGSVIVEVRDDGNGLNKEAILKKALSNGIIKEGETLPDPEIFQLIFAPGFSTAEKVTAISGRGVGMDVVRRDVESLGGRIEIDSAVGEGSTFKIIVPSA